jgi:hypothetical protein
MKNKSRKYKLQSGVQKIAMDTRDDSKAYKLQEEEGAKQQAISQGLGAISGNFKPVADVGDIAGSVVKSNFKTKGGAQLGGAISKGAAGAAAGAQIGSIIPGVGTGIGAAVGGLAGIGYGVFSAGNEYDEGKRLQNEADRVAAWKEYQKGYNTNGSATDAQAKVAKKGMYKVKVKGLLRAFKFNDAVAKKGNKARIHFGVMAQEVAKAFESEGLDANDYSLFCYDEWKASSEVLDEEGNVVSVGNPAGNMYGIRYEELLAFIISTL